MTGSEVKAATAEMPKKSQNSRGLEWLKSPWAILLAVLVGAYLGTYQPEVSMMLAPVGKIYLGLLTMCIIPILLSAITVSLGKMMRVQGASVLIRRMILVFALTLVATSIIGVGLSLVTGPGKDLGEDTMVTLGSFINQSKYAADLEVSLSEPYVAEAKKNGMDFFLMMVPQNIFSALSQGINLQILVFAILFAVALGRLPEHINAPFFEVLDAVYQAFGNLIRWLMYLLPIGLAILLAEQISAVGVEILFAMMKFVMVSLAVLLILFVFSQIIIWRRSGLGFLTALGGMKDTILVALATRSTLASIPSAMQSMHDRLQFEKASVDLVVPFGVTVCRYGNVAYTAVVAVFVMQLYHVELSVDALMVMVLGSILAGMATAGATGVLTLTMLAIVLEPLGLPLEAVLVLFIAIDPIVDPFRTMVSVHTACASTSLIAKNKNAHRNPEEAFIDELEQFDSVLAQGVKEPS
jgi:Na+/H+-dicarboxylate symporter